MSEIFWHKTDSIVKDLKLVKTSDWSQNTTLCMVFGLFLPTKGPIHGSIVLYDPPRGPVYGPEGTQKRPEGP